MTSKTKQISGTPGGSGSFKKHSLLSEIAKNKTVYLLISPFFIIFVVFILFPVCYSLFVSFTKWDGIGEMEFVGLKQYAFLFKDKEFLKAFGNTIIIWLMSTIPMLAISFIVAFLLNSGAIKYPHIFKTVFFLPNVTSIVAIAIIFSTIFGNHYGILNFIISMFGGEPVAWLKEPRLLQFSIATLVMWRWMGYNAVIYLAGLQRIPQDLYEAAAIDGANMRTMFRKITMPLMNPIIIFTVITTTIGGLQIFAEAQMLVEGTSSRGGGGGAGGGGLTMVFYLYRLAFINNQYSYACAVSWALFVIIACLSLLSWILMRRKN